ncbi:MAG: UvrD-helicase domain-containing protein [Myxococcota bacterium]|nr:UvrD-helicase domain-containing protein [Myxococcota bacterium]
MRFALERGGFTMQPMHIIADLHVHSRFSRATAKSLDFVSLHRAALLKGIHLIGTGDFTHPGWMGEIEEQLIPAEQGLFRLRPDLVAAAEDGVPAACSGEVRFVLQVEISNIYKKDGRTRKNHNLIFVPSIDAAKALTSKLAAIGNVTSDGRPILGLDARDLLEITLSSDPLAFLVPAHIWTPWFSLLGSKSGFDSIGECFGDLADHIFAVETGLSSDPPMNWRVSDLDRVTLISNSDAHSAQKLGREANLLDIDLGYEPLFNALRGGSGFFGTIEFFPEEGKYHLDGHRKCGIRLEPHRSREHEGRCPTCGGPITVGVMSRVMDLADRKAGYTPPKAPPFKSLVPLSEVAGEVLSVGPNSKKVQALVTRVLDALGPELTVLQDVPLEDIKRVGDAPLAEAIRRVRDKELLIAAGYDGEFGTIRIFDPGERDQLLGQMAIGGVKSIGPKGTSDALPAGTKSPKSPLSKGTFKHSSGPGITPSPTFECSPFEKGGRGDFESPSTSPSQKEAGQGDGHYDPLDGLDSDQQRVVETKTGPIIVVAGPGTGKTRTLVARIVHLIQTGAVQPDRVLAIAFTNQAANELRERLAQALGTPPDAAGPAVHTFHSFGLWAIEVSGNRNGRHIVEDTDRRDLVMQAAQSQTDARSIDDIIGQISLAKQHTDPKQFLAKDQSLLRLFDQYEHLLEARSALDVDDLVLCAYRFIEAKGDEAKTVTDRFDVVCVDEYQDVNDVQAAMVKQLCPDGRSLMVIGDPLQAIYGFRGAKPGHFSRFAEAFPKAVTVHLSTSYRLTDAILSVAKSTVTSPAKSLGAIRPGPPVEIVACPTAKSEAEQIVIRLERLIGGSSTFAVDSGRGGEAERTDVGFGDVAILSRTKAQRKAILDALGQSGIPSLAIGEDDPHDPRSQKVAVMTMHAAKGREFDTVFIAGVEPGLVPLDVGGLTAAPEEERRLLYVAITRAKRLCVISYAAKRTLFGQALPGGPSPFLSKVPPTAIVRTSCTLPPRNPAAKQLKLF